MMRFLCLCVLLVGCTLTANTQRMYARGSDIFSIYQPYQAQYFSAGWVKTYEKIYTDTIDATYCKNQQCQRFHLETRGYSGVFTVTITP